MTRMTKGPKIAEGRSAEIYAWGEDQVLKLYRPEWGIGAVMYEHKQALASQQTGYIVPAVGEIVEVDGRHGIIYQRIEGETMLNKLRQKPWHFARHARLMADLHLAMHRREAKNLSPAHNILKDKINHADPLDDALKEKVLAYLAGLPKEKKLLHGDFHPDNIMLTPNGPVIIDWIDASLGHPLADVARTVVIGNFGVPPQERFGRVLFKQMIRIYLRQYFRQSAYTRQDLQAWLLPVAAARLSERIPHETEPLTAYVQRLAEGLGIEE